MREFKPARTIFGLKRQIGTLERMVQYHSSVVHFLERDKNLAVHNLKPQPGHEDATVELMGGKYPASDFSKPLGRLDRAAVNTLKPGMRAYKDKVSARMEAFYIHNAVAESKLPADQRERVVDELVQTHSALAEQHLRTLAVANALLGKRTTPLRVAKTPLAKAIVDKYTPKQRSPQTLQGFALVRAQAENLSRFASFLAQNHVDIIKGTPVDVPKHLAQHIPRVGLLRGVHDESVRGETLREIIEEAKSESQSMVNAVEELEESELDDASVHKRLLQDLLVRSHASETALNDETRSIRSKLTK